MVKGLRYLATQLEYFQFRMIDKWNAFLKGLML